MASNNGNGSSEWPSPEKIICTCIGTMKTEKENAASEKAAEETNMGSMNEVRRYKLCCLDKTKDTHTTYQNLHNYVSYQQNLKTELLQEDITNFLAKDKDLEKLIKDSSKLLMDLKLKIEEAHNAGCVMKNCIANKLIIKDASDKSGLSPELQAIEDCYKEIGAKMERVNGFGQKSFDGMVTIAGIHTFSNVESLKDFGTTLGTEVSGFNTMVDAHMETAQGDLVVAQTEINEALTNLTNSKHNMDAACVEYIGLGSVLDILCKGECNIEDTVEEFCKEVSSDDKDETGPTKAFHHADDKN